MKKQPAKKKEWWIFGSSAKASPAKTSATPGSLSMIEVGTTKKQKSNPSMTTTPIMVSGVIAPDRREGSSYSGTSGAKGLVWVNTSSHVYHY